MDPDNKGALVMRVRLEPKTLIASVILATLASPAFADYACQGSVTGVQVSPAGLVSVNKLPGGTWMYLCQMGQTANNITPEAYKAIYSTLLTAEIAQKNVELWFRDDGHTRTDHTSWSYATTWYWGPMIID
jgi:hypothetical protein